MFRTLWLTRTAGVLCASVLMLWVGRGVGLWVMPGMQLDGAVVTTSGLARHARSWGEQSLRLELGYRVFQPTRSALGWELSVADAERELRELGRSANPLVTLRELGIGLFGAPRALRWHPKVRDADAVERFVQQLRDEIERLPLPGSYAPDGSAIEGVPGEALDVAATRRALEAALARSAETLQLSTIVTPPPRVFRRFERPDAELSVLMTTMETVYRAGTGRATNIELAARALHGTILLPGELLSFNERVGRRHAARGFAPALELVNGELTEGIGGGVCQVAGTLHAAAFYAGLAVDEYHAHSRLSRLAYLPPGLDAMVAWPDHVPALRDSKDMRVRNPYPFPIQLRVEAVRTAHHSVLRVQLYGAARPFRVETRIAELARHAAPELERLDPTLPRGEARVQQAGQAGLVLERSRTIYTPVRPIHEVTRVEYPATPRIVRVGTGPASLAHRGEIAAREETP
jgi:vancomycin resistance protein YoaR